MMAVNVKWPSWMLVNIINTGTILCLSLLPFVRARTRAISSVQRANEKSKKNKGAATESVSQEKLNGFFVSGIVDAEAAFIIAIYRRSNVKMG